MKRLRIALLATSALITVAVPTAHGNPLGPSVAAGDVTMDGLGSPDLTVNQTSSKAIIDWRSFNIDPTEMTKFVQPNSDSVVLNRVTGGEGASQVLGTLRANGQVFLVNPDGILIGEDATVDVGALVATTHDLFDGDFLSGNYEFGLSGKPDASVVNLGTITVNDSGFAALVAPGVRNGGMITARLGKVSLGSASSFTLDPYGDGLVTLGLSRDMAGEVIDVATGRPLTSLVANDGLIRAEGGTVQLTAAATRKVIDSVVNNTGTIQADTVGTRNGKIVLSASTARAKPSDLPAQKVKVSGKLSASGQRSGDTGGDIEITGEQIELAEATIDAYGWKGGGNVLVGGDKSGSGKLPPATTTTVDSATVIDASATQEGNGGKAVVWSDTDTRFDGTIVARGATGGGDGGFVEVSGRQLLDFNGRVDTSASAGSNGSLLLDPMSVTIGTTGAHAIAPATITAQLAFNNVVITTGSSGTEDGDITVAQPVSWSAANSLTLSAAGDINVNSTITSTGGANVSLRADSQGAGVGTITFGTGGHISAGEVDLYYNPTVNPADSPLNAYSYVNPTENFAPYVTAASFTPFMLVNTAEDLQNIQNNLSANYGLGRNVDASGTASWNAGAGFLPLGGYWDHPFTGKFDGGGHAIDQISIVVPAVLPAISPYASGVGLFGFVAGDGAVDNTFLTQASVTELGTYGGYTGLLIGWNYGTSIHNDHVQGAITAQGGGYVGGLTGFNLVEISDSSSSISISGSADSAGGLVGRNYENGRNARILRSSSQGSVAPNNPGANLGGLVGYNTGLVEDSTSTASVSGSLYIPFCFCNGGSSNSTGGLVGWNEGAISRSAASGDVTGGQAGGFVGVNHGDITGAAASGAILGSQSAGGFVALNQGTIEQASATGNARAVSGNGVGGFAGQNSGTIRNAYAMGSAQGSLYDVYDAGGFVGYGYGGPISSSYALKAGTGATYSGGFYGPAGAPGLSLAYYDVDTSGFSGDFLATALTDAELRSALPAGFDPAIWASNPNINAGYPYLRWEMNPQPLSPAVAELSPDSLVVTPSSLPPAWKGPNDLFGAIQTQHFSDSKAGLGQSVRADGDGGSAATGQQAAAAAPAPNNAESRSKAIVTTSIGGVAEAYIVSSLAAISSVSEAASSNILANPSLSDRFAYVMSNPLDFQVEASSLTKSNSILWTTTRSEATLSGTVDFETAETLRTIGTIADAAVAISNLANIGSDAREMFLDLAQLLGGMKLSGSQLVGIVKAINTYSTDPEATADTIVGAFASLGRFRDLIEHGPYSAALLNMIRDSSVAALGGSSSGQYLLLYQAEINGLIKQDRSITSDSDLLNQRLLLPVPTWSGYGFHPTGQAWLTVQQAVDGGYLHL